MSCETIDIRFVTQHRNAYGQYLERYKLAAGMAASSSRKEYSHFCRDLMYYCSDDKNLKSAADHLRTYGGEAPGPDGIRLTDYSQMDLWAAIRTLRNRLRGGEYERGPLRRCRVRKSLDSLEKRTIWLANVEDRIVTRGVSQILGPLLHSAIDPLSFCWVRRGPLLALAYARRLVMDEGRTTWIVEDARKAFDRVPRARLLQILKKYVPYDAFCQLVMHLIEPPTKTGILQGSSLSMMLLDVFLSHLLHRPWRKASLPPLLRYVDDCLVAAKPKDDSLAIYERLSQHLRNAGMQPKHGVNQAVIDLRWQSAVWLGYRLQFCRGQLEIRPKLFEHTTELETRRAHDFIVSRFAKLHDKTEGWRYQRAVLRGFVTHLAPTFHFVNREEIYAQLITAAREAGFEELLSLSDTVDCWKADYERWQWICDHLDELIASVGTEASINDEGCFLAAADCDPFIAPWE